MELNNLISKPTSPYRLALVFLLPFLVALSLLFFVLVSWEKQKIDNDQVSELKGVAQAFFDQIMVTRLWNLQHGGVYVEAPEGKQQSPLSEDPHREIVSRLGKRYTKLSPAYMTRELSEIANQTRGYKFRIVSLKPVSHANTPDLWETHALHLFDEEKASDAAAIVSTETGSRIFKYISPLRIEDPCLKCHSQEGFRHGDVKGGISISVPMDQSDEIRDMKLKRMLLSFVLVGIVSSFFVIVVTFILSRKLSAEIHKNIEREKLSAIVELAGATAHEMRQPMTVISNIVTLLERKVEHKEQVPAEEMHIVVDQCNRMNDIIKKMLNITSYKTKKYVKKQIVDIERSSGSADDVE